MPNYGCMLPNLNPPLICNSTVCNYIADGDGDPNLYRVQSVYKNNVVS